MARVRNDAMKIVIIGHTYEAFIDDLYARQPDLLAQDYAGQMQGYYASLFSSSDFYVNAFRQLRHSATEFIVNNARAQARWIEEDVSGRREPVTTMPFWRRVAARFDLRGAQDPGASTIALRSRAEQDFDVLLRQVRAQSPDVIFNQSVYAFDDAQLGALRGCAGALVGEHAAMPLPEEIDYRLYDLIVSSFPPTLDWLRRRGAKAELLRLSFDPRVAALIPPMERDVPVSFAGSFLPVHASRFALVEAAAAAVPELAVHGSVHLDIPESSPLAGRIAEPLWGRDMYRLLRRSRLTLNHHGDVPPFANNMRLYEATGMGCLLVTDHKDNLGEMFEPGREVVAYHDGGDCIDKVHFYLDERNAKERDSIMAAGMKRTLTEHTYLARMTRLVELIRAL